jgi:hypothetical protein
VAGMRILRAGRHRREDAQGDHQPSEGPTHIQRTRQPACG